MIINAYRCDKPCTLKYKQWSAKNLNLKVHWIITMTSQWVRWRLRPPALRLFTQSFIQAQLKENIKAPRHWLL